MSCVSVSDRSETALPIVVQVSRLPARKGQPGRLLHNCGVPELVFARTLLGLGHGRHGLDTTKGTTPAGLAVTGCWRLFESFLTRSDR